MSTTLPVPAQDEAAAADAPAATPQAPAIPDDGSAQPAGLQQALDNLRQRPPAQSRPASHHGTGPRLFEAAEADAGVPVERWMVSYADFITLMFVFFLALYTMLPKETHEELLGRIAQPTPKEAAPAASQASAPAANTPSAPELLSEVEAALAPLIDSGDVHARRVPRGVQLEIRDTALFEIGTAELNPRARNILAEVARIFRPRPNLLQIEGHTDPSPIQSALYPSNWELSAARASRVVRLLQEYGLRASRLSAVGMADTKPVGDNGTAEGRARNRRVAIVIIAP
jgi:chemotaxis protein MotB